ncbi:MAG: PSD1 and planctomycete cytochrome C domain-containing protein [Pirellulales bacterium]
MRKIFAGICLLLLTSSAVLADGDGTIDFNRDIRPILSENCFQCHGPDKAQRKGDLRLDIREDAVAAHAFAPGKPDVSELVARIFHSDPDMLMPPADSFKKLTDQQKGLLKQWVAEGAEYKGHWAYLPAAKPAVPAGANAIDYLVRQRLSAQNLQPAPEADRTTLIRRLYFDLLGLPPTPHQVDAFVQDMAPDAYEKVVAELMSSPHYGERQAIAWLDVVRFADTIGYHSDTPRNVWPYRDYVIRAFNQNKPFDLFTIEQLAGDLLPDCTAEQKVASCFNRLLLTTEEGGAQAKDYEARMMGDRVRAVGTVWLGQTIGCCQCHDHKFDPLPTRDFYSLGAFFADIQEPIIGAREPGMLVMSDAQSQEFTRRQAAQAEAQKQFDQWSPALQTAQDAWMAEISSELARWQPLHPEQVAADHGVTFKVEPDESVLSERNPEGGTETYRVTFKTSLKEITGIRLDVLPHPSLPAQGPGRAANGNLVLTEFSLADSAGQPIPLSRAVATHEQPEYPIAGAIDGKAESNNGWAIGGKLGVGSSACFELQETVGTGEEITLVATMQQMHGENHTIGRFRLSATTAAKPVVAPTILLPPQEIVDLIKIEAEKRDDAQKSKLLAHFKGLTPLLADVRTRLADTQRLAKEYEDSLPRCLTSNSAAQRVVRILPRGNWQDESGEPLKPALPSFLAQGFATDDKPLNRLDLAHWITSRDNPLTARVFVNRLWKQYFGIGLCKTLDDLGSQGEWPVHPELLDWLACEFMYAGWDVKHMVREIVLSQTYRQASTATPEMLALDPENRLLARQSRFRLDAELVRDNALAVSGLLVPKVGGPSVKPYQPDGYWENLNFPVRSYPTDTGENQYRRGLYTWWQRSFVHPSMLAFDAPTREECAADRVRSNIPQQALVLLNDPTYVEAARAFAARIITEGGSDIDTRLNWAWKQALSRPPRDDERQVVKELLERSSAHYAQDSVGAEELLKVGFSPVPEGIDHAELAAWTNGARVILNLHETITRN